MSSSPPIHGSTSVQSSLAGFDVRPVPTDRLFFAIFPDADAALRIAWQAQQLRGQHGLRGRPLAKDRFHVTLHHLGDYVGLPADTVASARRSAAAVAVGAESFPVSFDRVGSFQRGARNSPLVLRGGDGLAKLTAFHQALGIEMKKTGLGRCVESGFTPHVTLLYDDRNVPEQDIEPISWTVDRLVLVHSLLGRTMHVPLGEWLLRSGPG
jgi:2'-5' RNA ligase